MSPVKWARQRKSRASHIDPALSLVFHAQQHLTDTYAVSKFIDSGLNRRSFGITLCCKMVVLIRCRTSFSCFCVVNNRGHMTINVGIIRVGSVNDLFNFDCHNVTGFDWL